MGIYARHNSEWYRVDEGGSAGADLVGGVAGWASIDSVSGTADLTTLKNDGIVPNEAKEDPDVPGTYNVVQDGVEWRVAVFTETTGTHSLTTSDGLVDTLLCSSGYGAGITYSQAGRVNKGILKVTKDNHNVFVGEIGAQKSAYFADFAIAPYSGDANGLSARNGAGSLDDSSRRDGLVSAITGSFVEYGHIAPITSYPTIGSYDKSGIVVVRSPKDATQPWEPAPELPGLGGWATITDVKGKGNKYSYTNADGDWVALEWLTGGGSVKTTAGLVEALLVGGGARGATGTGGGVIDSVLHLKDGTSTVTVGIGGGGTPPSADWTIFGKPSLLTGPHGSVACGAGIHMGGVPSVGGAYGGPHMSAITGGPARAYSGQQGEPGVRWEDGTGAASNGEHNGHNGSVIVRVPKANYRGNLPDGAFDIPTTRQAIVEAIEEKVESVKDTMIIDGRERKVKRSRKR